MSRYALSVFDRYGIQTVMIAVGRPNTGIIEVLVIKKILSRPVRFQYI
jgi:hypothetical protein